MIRIHTKYSLKKNLLQFINNDDFSSYHVYIPVTNALILSTKKKVSILIFFYIIKLKLHHFSPSHGIHAYIRASQSFKNFIEM